MIRHRQPPARRCPTPREWPRRLGCRPAAVPAREQIIPHVLLGKAQRHRYGAQHNQPHGKRYDDEDVGARTQYSQADTRNPERGCEGDASKVCCLPAPRTGLNPNLALRLRRAESSSREREEKLRVKGLTRCAILKN